MATATAKLATDATLALIKSAIEALPNATQTAADNANAAAAAATAAVASLGGLVANTYSASSTYNVGDYVYYNSKLYRCIVKISTAEAFNADHWMWVALGNDVRYDMKGAGVMILNESGLSTLTGGTKSVNDFPRNRIVCVGTTGIGLLDYPKINGGIGTYVTFYGYYSDANYNGSAQMFISTDGLAVRWKGSNTWGAWVLLDFSDVMTGYPQMILNETQLSTMTGGTKSVNDFPRNKAVCVAVTNINMVNGPDLDSGIGTYFTIYGNYSDTYHNGSAQIFIGASGMAFRWKGSNSWGAWKTLHDEAYYLAGYQTMIINATQLSDATGESMSVHDFPRNKILCVGAADIGLLDYPKSVTSNGLGVYITPCFRTGAGDGNGECIICISTNGIATKWRAHGSWTSWITYEQGEEVYYVGQGQEYTSLTYLLYVLRNNTAKKVIYIMHGAYDLFTEFKYEVSEGRLTDPPSGANPNNYMDYNPMIPTNTRIVGLGQVILNFSPNVNDITYEESYIWSPLNPKGNFELENITVIAKNCRYALHNDDHDMYQYVKQHYKGCRFLYTLGDTDSQDRQRGLNAVIGFGINKGSTHEYDDCEFSFIGSGNHPAFYGHEHGASGYNNGTIIVRNSIIKSSDYYNQCTIRLQTLGKNTTGNIGTRFDNCYITGGLDFNMYYSDSVQSYEVTFSNCNKVPVYRTNREGGTIVDPYTTRFFNPLALPTASDPLYETDSYSA